MDLEKFRHGKPLSESNNAVNGGPMLLAPSAVDTSHAITYTKAHVPSGRFVTVLVTNVLVLCRQQIDQVEFGLSMPVCANTRQVTVCVAMCFKYRLQRLLPGDYTRRSARCGRFCVRQRRAVRRR